MAEIVIYEDLSIEEIFENQVRLIVSISGILKPIFLVIFFQSFIRFSAQLNLQTPSHLLMVAAARVPDAPKKSRGNYRRDGMAPRKLFVESIEDSSERKIAKDQQQPFWATTSSKLLPEDVDKENVCWDSKSRGKKKTGKNKRNCDEGKGCPMVALRNEFRSIRI